MRIEYEDYREALIFNQCHTGTFATVSLDWSWDPDCVWVPGRGTATVTWDHDTTPDYAYEC